MKRLLTLLLFAGLLGITGLNAQEKEQVPPEVRMENRDILENVALSGSRKVTIQRGQNFFDSGTGNFSVHSLSISPDSVAHYTHSYRADYLFRVSKYNVQPYKIERNNLVVLFSEADAKLSEGRIEKDCFTFADVWEGIDFSIQLLPEGIKTYYTITNNAAKDSFAVQVQVVGGRRAEKRSNGIYFGTDNEDVFYMPDPYAYDVNGRSVSLSWNLEDRGNRQYITFSIESDTGAVYPITIDPKIIFDEGDANIEDTGIASDGPANNWGGSPFIDAINGTTFKHYTLMRFVLTEFSADTMSVTSCSLIVQTSTFAGASSDTMYLWTIPSQNRDWVEGDNNISAADSGETDYDQKKSDIEDWEWGKSFYGILGADWGKHTAIDSIMPAEYDPTTDGDSLIFVISSDTLQAYLGDTLNVFVANIDTSVSSNLGARFHSSEAATASDRPVFMFEYNPIYRLSIYDDTLSAITDSSFRVIFKDSSSFTKGYYFNQANGTIIGDTVFSAGTGHQRTLVDTITNSYTPNYLDSIYIVMFDSTSPPDTLMSKLHTAYTLAKIPTIPEISGISDSTFFLVFEDTTDNPGTVLYALWDSIFATYRDTTGDTTSTIVFASESAWDSITMAGYIPNSEMNIGIFARNGDSILTDAISDTAWVWAAIPGTTYTSVIDSVRLNIRLSPNGNPYYTYFAVEDSISGLFISRTTRTLRSANVTADSTWAFGTYSEWGGSQGDTITVTPGQTYYFRAYAKDGNSNP